MVGWGGVTVGWGGVTVGWGGVTVGFSEWGHALFPSSEANENALVVVQSTSWHHVARVLMPTVAASTSVGVLLACGTGRTSPARRIRIPVRPICTRGVAIRDPCPQNILTESIGDS